MPILASVAVGLAAGLAINQHEAVFNAASVSLPIIAWIIALLGGIALGGYISYAIVRASEGAQLKQIAGIYRASARWAKCSSGRRAESLIRRQVLPRIGALLSMYASLRMFLRASSLVVALLAGAAAISQLVMLRLQLVELAEQNERSRVQQAIQASQAEEQLALSREQFERVRTTDLAQILFSSRPEDHPLAMREAALREWLGLQRWRNVPYIDLRRASLQGLDLRGWDLRRCDLTAANLKATELAGARLTGSVIENAKFDSLLQILQAADAPQPTYLGLVSDAELLPQVFGFNLPSYPVVCLVGSDGLCRAWLRVWSNPEFRQSIELLVFGGVGAGAAGSLVRQMLDQIQLGEHGITSKALEQIRLSLVLSSPPTLEDVQAIRDHRLDIAEIRFIRVPPSGGAAVRDSMSQAVLDELVTWPKLEQIMLCNTSVEVGDTDGSDWLVKCAGRWAASICGTGRETNLALTFMYKRSSFLEGTEQELAESPCAVVTGRVTSGTYWLPWGYTHLYFDLRATP